MNHLERIASGPPSHQPPAPCPPRKRAAPSSPLPLSHGCWDALVTCFCRLVSVKCDRHCSMAAGRVLAPCFCHLIADSCDRQSAHFQEAILETEARAQASGAGGSRGATAAAAAGWRRACPPCASAPTTCPRPWTCAPSWRTCRRACAHLKGLLSSYNHKVCSALLRTSLRMPLCACVPLDFNQSGSGLPPL